MSSHPPLLSIPSSSNLMSAAVSPPLLTSPTPIASTAASASASAPAPAPTATAAAAVASVAAAAPSADTSCWYSWSETVIPPPPQRRSRYHKKAPHPTPAAAAAAADSKHAPDSKSAIDSSAAQFATPPRMPPPPAATPTAAGAAVPISADLKSPLPVSTPTAAASAAAAAASGSGSGASDGLVEFVAVFEAEKSPFKHSGTGGLGAGPGGTDYLRQSLLKGECTYRVPANMKLDVPAGAEFFIFPSGIQLRTTALQPFVHSLILTAANGKLMYAFCYTRYVELDKHVLSVLRMQIANRLMNMEDDPGTDELPTMLYGPQCLCVCSYYSYHDAFFQLLIEYCAHLPFNAELADRLYYALNRKGPSPSQSLTLTLTLYPSEMMSYLRAHSPSVYADSSATSATVLAAAAAAAAAASGDSKTLIRSPSPAPAPVTIPSTATVVRTPSTDSTSPAAAAAPNVVDSVSPIDSVTASTPSDRPSLRLVSSASSAAIIDTSAASTPSANAMSLAGSSAVSSSLLADSSPANATGSNTPAASASTAITPSAAATATTPASTSTSTSEKDAAVSLSPAAASTVPVATAGDATGVSLILASERERVHAERERLRAAAHEHEREDAQRISVVFERPPYPFESSSVPWISTAQLMTLFRHLEPRHVLTIINTLLCEEPVLVLAQSIDVLTPVLEAIHSLMYPFKWPHINIPVLPLQLTEFFEAPMPFLIGALHDALQSLPSHLPTLVVNLNTNSVAVANVSSSGTTPASATAASAASASAAGSASGSWGVTPLPWRLNWRLYTLITTHFNVYQHYHPEREQSLPDNLPPNAVIPQSHVPAPPPQSTASSVLAALASPLSAATSSVNSAIAAPHDMPNVVVAGGVLGPRLLSRAASNSLLTLRTVSYLHSGSDDDSEGEHAAAADAASKSAAGIASPPHASQLRSPSGSGAQQSSGGRLSIITSNSGHPPPHPTLQQQSSTPNAAAVASPKPGFFQSLFHSSHSTSAAAASGAALPPHHPHSHSHAGASAGGVAPQSPLPSDRVSSPHPLHPPNSPTPVLAGSHGHTIAGSANAASPSSLTRSISQFFRRASMSGGSAPNSPNPLHHPQHHSSGSPAPPSASTGAGGGPGFTSPVAAVSGSSPALSLSRPHSSSSVPAKLASLPAPLTSAAAAPATPLTPGTPLSGTSASSMLSPHTPLITPAPLPPPPATPVSLVSGSSPALASPRTGSAIWASSPSHVAALSLGTSSGTGASHHSQIGGRRSSASERPVSGFASPPAAGASIPLVCNVRKLRRGFLAAFVSLLHGYRDFYVDDPAAATAAAAAATAASAATAAPTAAGSNAAAAAAAAAAAVAPLEQALNLFDKSKFVGSVAEDYRAFMTPFVETQMFQNFMQERYQLQSAAGDWFERELIAKSTKRALKSEQNSARGMVGVLWKLGREVRTWKERYFELSHHGGNLQYFANFHKVMDTERTWIECRAQLKAHPSDRRWAQKWEDSCRERDKIRKESFKGCFVLQPGGKTKIVIPTDAGRYKTPYVFEIVCPDRRMVCCAPNEETRDDWIQIIRARTSSRKLEFFKRFGSGNTNSNSATGSGSSLTGSSGGNSGSNLTGSGSGSGSGSSSSLLGSSSGDGSAKFNSLPKESSLQRTLRTLKERQWQAHVEQIQNKLAHHSSHFHAALAGTGTGQASNAHGAAAVTTASAIAANAKTDMKRGSITGSASTSGSSVGTSDELRHALVVAEMMLQNLDIRDRQSRLRTQVRCFVGSEAVEWMINAKIAPDVLTALSIGNTLIAAGVMHHVTRDHAFKNDDTLLYRFTAHKTPESYRASGSLQVTDVERVILAAMKGTANALTGGVASAAGALSATLGSGHVVTAAPSPKAAAAAAQAGGSGACTVVAACAVTGAATATASTAASTGGGLDIRDRSWGLRVYPKSFVGKEAVAWMIKERVAVNESDAIRIGNRLMYCGEIVHVTNDHTFKNAFIFYRFTTPAEKLKIIGKAPATAAPGTAAAAATAESGAPASSRSLPIPTSKSSSSIASSAHAHAHVTSSISSGSSSSSGASSRSGSGSGSSVPSTPSKISPSTPPALGTRALAGSISLIKPAGSPTKISPSASPPTGTGTAAASPAPSLASTIPLSDDWVDVAGGSGGSGPSRRPPSAPAATAASSTKPGSFFARIAL